MNKKELLSFTSDCPGLDTVSVSAEHERRFLKSRPMPDTAAKDGPSMTAGILNAQNQEKDQAKPS